MDPRRYVTEAFAGSEPVGDFWFATDAAGHALAMTPRAGALLGWSGVGGAALAEAPSPALKGSPRRRWRSREPRASTRSTASRCASPPRAWRATGWVLFEGLSEEALATIRSEADRAFLPASFSDLKREILLFFAILALAVLAAVGVVSRRVSAPVEALVRAAEDIGRGRPIELGGREGPDEMGRLAAALDAMGLRVSRRVETLRRLHQFSRTAYRMTDVGEVLARATHAIAAFTGAERVWPSCCSIGTPTAWRRGCRRGTCRRRSPRS